MDNKNYIELIARELQLPQRGVGNTLQLLDEGCTIPFISRYRKERTGGFDEVQIAAISDRYERLKETAKRKETILSTIETQGKLTDELRTAPNWKTSICLSNPSDAPVHKWRENRDWNRCRSFS